MRCSFGDRGAVDGVLPGVRPWRRRPVVPRFRCLRSLSRPFRPGWSARAPVCAVASPLCLVPRGRGNPLVARASEMALGQRRRNCVYLAACTGLGLGPTTRRFFRQECWGGIVDSIPEQGPTVRADVHRLRHDGAVLRPEAGAGNAGPHGTGLCAAHAFLHPAEPWQRHRPGDAVPHRRPGGEGALLDPGGRAIGRRVRLLDDPVGRELHRRQYPGTGQPGRLQDHDGPVHGLGPPGDRRHHPDDPGLHLRPARRGGRRPGRGAEVEADHHGDDRHRAVRAAVRARRPAAVAGGAGHDRLLGRRGIQAHRGHWQHSGAVDPVYLGLQGRAGHEHLHRARDLVTWSS